MTCDSGRGKACWFCPECGTRIYHTTMDKVVSIKAGTFDDTSWIQPTEHYWTSRKQAWTPIPEGSRCFEDDG